MGIQISNKNNLMVLTIHPTIKNKQITNKKHIQTLILINQRQRMNNNHHQQTSLHAKSPIITLHHFTAPITTLLTKSPQT